MVKSMASSTPEFEKIYLTEMINMLAECNEILLIIALQE